MDVTLASGDNVLYPLLHCVVDDLPTSTKAPEIDFTHTTQLLAGTDIRCSPMDQLVGLYIAYLVKVGFLVAPRTGAAAGASKPKRTLPRLNLDAAIMLARSSQA